MEKYSLDRFLYRYFAALDKTKKSSLNTMSALVLRSKPLLDEFLTQSKNSNPQSQSTIDLNSRSTIDLQSFNENSAPDATKFAAIADDAAQLAKESSDKTTTSALSTFNEVMQSQLQRFTLLPTETAPNTNNPNWNLGTDKTYNAVNQLFKGLLGMRSDVASLDQTVGKVFDKMNNRYQDTWVEQTDALPPLTSNTIVRVGINVQRNYTPFTLTGGSTVGTAAAAAVTQQSASASPAGGQQGGGQGGGGQQGGSKGSQPTGQQSSSQSPSSSSSGATSTTGSNDFTVLMEVHRLANFNLVGGVMGIHAKNYSYASVPEYAAFTAGSGVSSGSSNTPQYTYTAYVTCPSGSNVTMTTPGAVQVNGTSGSASVTPSPSLYYCLNQTQTASLQPAGMVGVAWFPWQRDYFSRGRGTMFQGRDMIPSFMAASSVTSLGSVFFGPNFEPFNGLDLFGGWGTSNVTGLAKGTSLNQVFLPGGSSNAAPTINTATHVKGGITFGVGFDISVFLQLFGKAQGPSLP